MANTVTLRDTTSREQTVARAVLVAKSYYKKPNIEKLTELARKFALENTERTATDIAYLVVRHFDSYQQEILA
jgi:hypothetical protein